MSLNNTKSGKTKVLSANDNSDAERNLYYYTGYYPCDTAKNGILVYVKTDARGFGYFKRTLFPGSICINEDDIDMSTAIIFNLDEQAVNTGFLQMDDEVIRLIQARGKELGFGINPKEKLRKKIWDWKTDNNVPVPSFSEEEIILLMTSFYENN